MAYSNHGGGCCGYKHIYALDVMTIAQLDAVLDDHFNTEPGNGGDNRVVEIILSERQVNPAVENLRRQTACVRAAGGWPTVLAARGFIFTRRWRNSNSRNYCYQFLKVTEWASMAADSLPFDYPTSLKLVTPRSRTQDNGPLPVVAPVAPPPPPRATVVRSRYVNNYVNGTSSPWYESLARAVDAAPRCRIRQRVDIMSDGTIRFDTVQE